MPCSVFSIKLFSQYTVRCSNSSSTSIGSGHTGCTSRARDGRSVGVGRFRSSHNSNWRSRQSSNGSKEVLFNSFNIKENWFMTVLKVVLVNG